MQASELCDYLTYKKMWDLNVYVCRQFIFVPCNLFLYLSGFSFCFNLCFVGWTYGKIVHGNGTSILCRCWTSSICFQPLWSHGDRKNCEVSHNLLCSYYLFCFPKCRFLFKIQHLIMVILAYQVLGKRWNSSRHHKLWSCMSLLCYTISWLSRLCLPHLLG
jgi:hypothetical protein